VIVRLLRHNCPFRMSEQNTNDRRSPELIRGLGLWAGMAVVVGSMIGQSVFLVTSDMARELGSTTKVLLLWIVGGIVVLCGALCYAELGATMPEAGGDYVYLSRGLGHLWGFLFGWTSAMILKPAPAAVITAGIVRLAGFVVPSITTPIFTWHLRLPFLSHPCQFILSPAQPLAVTVIVVVTALNYFAVKTVGRFQILLTTLKVAGVVAIVILGLIPGKVIKVEPASSLPVPAHAPTEAILIAVVPVMLAYNGFQWLGNVGGELVNPRTNLPRAAILGTSLVITLYVLINWIYFHILGLSNVAESEHVASDALTVLVRASGAKWLTAFMIVSAFGSLHAGFLTGPRISYAMASDGNFFRFAEHIHPVFHSPSKALMFQGCMATALVLTGTYQELYSYDMFATWAFFPLTVVALFRLRRTEPGLTRPYRVWGYPWSPLVFGVAALGISLNLFLLRPVRSSIGLAIMLLGIPFFRHWRKRALRISVTNARS
jgi:basic amino acid/polyamine antiporter, APA family